MFSRLKLIKDWRQVLKNAWSIRLLIVAGLLSGAEIALPLIDEIAAIPRGVFASLSFAATAGAFVARIVAQQKFEKDQP